jgi:hypothetical protein
LQGAVTKRPNLKAREELCGSSTLAAAPNGNRVGSMKICFVDDLDCPIQKYQKEEKCELHLPT